MLTTQAKTYSVLSIGSRRQNVQVTATDLELMLSSCGGQTVAASTIRAKARKRDAWHAPTCYKCTATATAAEFVAYVTTTQRLEPSTKL